MMMQKLLYLTKAQFDALPEYSATMPTGTTPGKRWKRIDGEHDQQFIAKGGKPRWIIGEYDPNAPSDAEITQMLKRGEQPPQSIKVNWYRPIIRVRAVGRPL